MSFRHRAAKSATTCLLIADRALARFLVGTWPELDDCEEVDALVHPISRLREHDTVSDGPGRFRTPAGHPTAAEATTDFQTRTTTEFARELCARLERGRTNAEFGRWIVVAPPKLLGELRRVLPPPLARLMEVEIEKELAHLELRDVLPHVREAIAGARAAATKE